MGLHFARGHLPCSSLLQRIDQSQSALTYIRSEIRLPLRGADPEPALQHPASPRDRPLHELFP